MPIVLFFILLWLTHKQVTLFSFIIERAFIAKISLDTVIGFLVIIFFTFISFKLLVFKIVRLICPSVISPTVNPLVLTTTKVPNSFCVII